MALTRSTNIQSTLPPPIFSTTFHGPFSHHEQLSITNNRNTCFFLVPKNVQTFYLERLNGNMDISAQEDTSAQLQPWQRKMPNHPSKEVQEFMKDRSLRIERRDFLDSLERAREERARMNDQESAGGSVKLLGLAMSQGFFEGKREAFVRGKLGVESEAREVPEFDFGSNGGGVESFGPMLGGGSGLGASRTSVPWTKDLGHQNNGVITAGVVTTSASKIEESELEIAAESLDRAEASTLVTPTTLTPYNEQTIDPFNLESLESETSDLIGLEQTLVSSTLGNNEQSTNPTTTTPVPNSPYSSNEEIEAAPLFPDIPIQQSTPNQIPDFLQQFEQCILGYPLTPVPNNEEFQVLTAIPDPYRTPCSTVSSDGDDTLASWHSDWP